MCRTRYLNCWTSSSLGRRIRQSAGGVFTRQGYVVPDGNWKPTEGQELRIAPEAPTGFFRLELRLGEERAELTLPAGQELVEVRERMEAVGLPNCAVTAFHSRVPQLPAAWATPERLDTLNCLAIRLMVLAERGLSGPDQVQGGAGGVVHFEPGGCHGVDGTAGRLQSELGCRLTRGRGPRGAAPLHRGRRMPTCYAGT